MKAKLTLLTIVLLAFVGCSTTQPVVSSNLQSPELKLRITGVDQVKAETSDTAERQLALQEKQISCDVAKLEMEKEKWEYEKRQKDLDWTKSKLSNFVDIEGPIPVFNLFSYISLADWQNIQKDFAALWKMGKREIILRTFSGGGSAFAGLGIADTINEWVNHGMKITGKAYGMIASATVPIFAACSKRIAGSSTLFMVHEAATFKFFAFETHSDIKAEGDMFDLMQDKYISVLVRHSKLDADEWKNKIKNTTWFTVEKAKEWGIVDEVE